MPILWDVLLHAIKHSCNKYKADVSKFCNKTKSTRGNFVIYTDNTSP